MAKKPRSDVRRHKDTCLSGADQSYWWNKNTQVFTCLQQDFKITTPLQSTGSHWREDRTGEMRKLE